MENISIKVHPPWYARGTPVINTRDGPPMALSDKPLFAIREGPSARGEPGEGRGKGRGGSPELAVGSWQSAVARLSEIVGQGRPESEDRSRGKPGGKTRLWLTLKTTFFNTQNSVYGQCYAVLGRKWLLVLTLTGLATLSGRGKQTCQRAQLLTTSNWKWKWLTLTFLLTLTGTGTLSGRGKQTCQRAELLTTSQIGNG